MDTQEINKNMKEFDEEHIIEQIILIGADGKVRNYKFDVEEQD